VPLPVPLLPEVIVMKELLLTAVQLQAALAVTATLADPPPATKLKPVGLIDAVEHGSPPLHSAGTSVAAMCVVPSLPTADTPIPWRAKTVQIAQRLAPPFMF
jgi:hypothetical protein